MANCPICEERITQEIFSDGDNEVYDCSKCGRFILSGSVAYGSKLPHTASSWIWEQNKLFGRPPKITTDIYEKLKNIPDKTIHSKLEALMIEINSRYLSSVSKIVTINPQADPSWLSITWTRNADELLSIVKEAVDKEFISVTEKITWGGGTPWLLRINFISFRGHEFIESLGQTNGNSNKVFLAFNFTDAMKASFEVTAKRAVEDTSSGKLEAVRVSTSATDTDRKIDDELIAMLKSSKIVIADFTGQRPAVYYEAGYAMGLGIPVIWTCRTDEVDSLSFDTRQYPHILWADEEDLYKQLTDRLSARYV